MSQSGPPAVRSSSRQTFRRLDLERVAALGLAPSLRSLAGETLEESGRRVVVFDGGPKYIEPQRSNRYAPGEPVNLLFLGDVSAPSLSSKMFVYELGGGRRALPFTLEAKPRDAKGRVPIAVTTQTPLEPGAKFAIALSPAMTHSGSSPEIYRVNLAPSPCIEGIGCPADATKPEHCRYRQSPGEIVDIEEALYLLSSSQLTGLPRDAIQVTPPLADLTTAVESGNRLVIKGAWTAGQVYEVRLREVRDNEGRFLARLAPLAVRSAGRAPEVRAAAGTLTFERDARPELGFWAMHIDEGSLRSSPVPPGQELQAILLPQERFPEDNPAAYTTVPLSTIAPEARPNRWGKGLFPWMEQDPNRSTVAVLSFLPGKAATASTKGPTASTKGPTAFVQWTDLGITARLTERGVLVWVTSLATASPVAGARVEVGAAKGEILASGVTDAAGLLWLELAPEETRNALAIKATTGEDRSALSVDSRKALGPRHFDLPLGQNSLEAGLPVAAVFTDRGACRPGETLHAKAIVRQRLGDILVPASQGEVVLRLFGPTGKAPMAERRVTLGGVWDRCDGLSPGCRGGGGPLSG